MPALGVAQQTGTLLKWLKAEGQSVTKGEPLMEIETDKATVEIEAAASGILTQVSAKPGDEVPVGQTIALILAPGETLPTHSSARGRSTHTSSPGAERAGARVRAKRQHAYQKVRPATCDRMPMVKVDEFSPHRRPSESPKSRESSLDRFEAAARREVYSPRTCSAPRRKHGSSRSLSGIRQCAAHPHAPHRRPAHDPEQTERAAFLH